MKLAIGCDHGGLELAQAVRDYLKQRDIPFEDFGTFTKESVDYPLIAVKVARAVASGQVKGARASVCTNEECARMTRKDNDSNILCMGGNVVDAATGLKILQAYLDTEFEGGRHARRVGQIAQIESGEI